MITHIRMLFPRAIDGGSTFDDALTGAIAFGHALNCHILPLPALMASSAAVANKASSDWSPIESICACAYFENAIPRIVTDID